MKKVLIFGAYINNKGAQSMLYTVIDKIKSKDPDCKIYVVREKKVEVDIKENYSFDFLEIGMKSKLKLAGKPFSLLSILLKNNEIDYNLEKVKSLFDKSTIFIDISGFALSSKFSRNSTINYLANISIAKRFNVPFYIMPQSFGPFNYSFLDKKILIPMIKKYLNYPVRIYAREKEGYDLLSSFGLNNIYKSLDIVFHQNKELDLSNIYNDKVDTVKFKNVDIKPNSVAIIPNIKTIKKENKEKIYNLYIEAINYLTSNHKYVYLLRHSSEDLNIIQDIYNKFENNKKVYLIKEEYSSIELQNILKKFDYTIASRYHSIVHSYKVGVPAIVLGWAVKYKELLEEFNQENYQFDIKKIDSKIFVEKLAELDKNFKKEKKIISNRLDIINDQDPLDKIIK
ncbi:polysaccharide pyruvyl transferase family protein [Salinicoccus roseus]|uniref:polysaccharide pyruvyl transferase family protein n=1 Tax=Salinicoccus roseus TaxID=45670 RepID=UPI00352559A2